MLLMISKKSAFGFLNPFYMFLFSIFKFLLLYILLHFFLFLWDSSILLF